MPLPKPPIKKASILSTNDYRSTSPSAPTDVVMDEDVNAPALAKSTPRTKAKPVKNARTSAATKATPLVSENAAAIAPLHAPIAAPAPVSAKPQTSAKSTKAKRTDDATPKLFVLDTNVLMHDPTSLFRFAEHDVFLPMITLEELDGHKKGMSEVSRNVRQVSRELDGLAADSTLEPGTGIALNKTGHREATGRLYFQTAFMDAKLPVGLPQGKADNQILGIVQALSEHHKDRNVILVSKDINMRVKARALGLRAEDYQNDKTLEDGDVLHTGSLALPIDFWERAGKNIESWQQNGATFYRISGPMIPQLVINLFVYLEHPGVAPFYAKVVEITGKNAVLRTCKDYTHAKQSVWGIVARNREQNFALNLLMDPECDFVTLTGTAGTGKTLITLAAALSQVLDERRYAEILVTRVTVPVGEDIGFLPGTEEEKMGPWMGALDDNLEVLARGDSTAGEWGRAATNELVRSKIRIKSMNFMRGRTFLNKFVIIDEAQNLTPKQMKTLITRAGPGTKIVCLGNLAQIDTPYLTEGSSGLTYAVDRFKGWPHSGHLMLARGERSRLADYASEVL